MKIGTIILFLFTIKLSAQTTTRDQFINPTGTYILKGLLVKNNITGHSGELRVKLIESKNKVALAFYINNGYPGYESGSFVDTVNYSENQALYKPPSDHDCTIIFSFSVKNAEIQQIYVDPDCTCGFAKGILASSLFRKYSSEIPVIQDLIRSWYITLNSLHMLKVPKINTIVQISLDLTNIDEALETAVMALRAGVDWLEAGTPLILAEGLHGVKKLREAFPGVPIVADLKTMDGGYLEAEMMAKAGATHVVVMARAHEETIRCVVKAGIDYGIKVMGDNLGCPDMVAAAVWLENLGCDYIVHHIGYDERRGIAARGRRMPSPLDQLSEVVNAVNIPVQAVGGLSLDQAIQCPAYGAPLVVLGAPLTIDADSFKTADGNLESSLRLICKKIHAYNLA